MINKARQKITEEALKINNNFSIFIEEYINEICTNEKVATKILDTEKSLSHFCNKCEREAKEKARAQGTGCQIVGLPDVEYFKLVDEYYGITDEDKMEVKAGDTIDIMDLL